MRLLMMAAATLSFAAFSLFAQAQPGRQAPSAQEILERADEARFPQEGFEIMVRIQTTEDGRPAETRGFKVLSKGNENTIVLTLEPASERGQMMLMRGRDLWVFLPRVSQPVRISLAQRLTGQVANGDIARANFVGDYSPSLAGTERVGNDNFYVLELAAVDRKVTYQRVRYWVRQKDYRPHKAEFYSLAGRLLKTCLYEDFRVMGGKLRPGRLVMTDAITKGSESRLVYSDLRLRDLPDQIFTKEYLRRLD